jgi:hypothetical protein
MLVLNDNNNNNNMNYYYLYYHHHAVEYRIIHYNVRLFCSLILILFCRRLRPRRY